MQQASIGIALLALLAWRLFAWSFVPTLLSALLLVYVLHARQAQPGKLGVIRRHGHKSHKGTWRVTIIKAEIVTDEPWSGELSLLTKASRQ